MQVAVVEDYTNLRERQAFYVVSVPGETGWVKEVRRLLASTELSLTLPHSQKLDGETSESELLLPPPPAPH